MQAQTRREQARNAGTQYADDDVSDQAEAVALDQQAGEPACNGTNDDPGKDGFRGEHVSSPLQVPASPQRQSWCFGSAGTGIIPLYRRPLCPASLSSAHRKGGLVRTPV